jgi:DNA-binding MarR family transcriptional regulator
MNIDDHGGGDLAPADGPARGVSSARVLARGVVRDHRLVAWGEFLRAHAAVKAKLERELLTERGLQLTWYEVLLHLDGRSGELRMQELARSVLLSKSGLTRLIDRMESAGLVVRQTCESDRRGSFVSITPEGARVFRAAAPVHLRGIAEHFTSHLSAEELAVLQGALARVADAADESAAGGEGACPEAGG